MTCLLGSTRWHGAHRNGHSKPVAVKAPGEARNGSHPSTGSPFIYALDAELGRLRRFVGARSEELWGRLLAVIEVLLIADVMVVRPPCAETTFEPIPTCEQQTCLSRSTSRWCASHLISVYHRWSALLALLQVLPQVPGQEDSASLEAEQEATAALADCDAIGTLNCLRLIISDMAHALQITSMQCFEQNCA